MSRFKNKENLDKAMDKKWAQLRAKHPKYNGAWIIAMHNLVDWYEENLYKLMKRKK